MRREMAIATALATLLAALACGGNGSPGSGSELDLALENYLDALGGRTRLEALSTVHTRDSIHMAGLSGTTESWYSRTPFRGRTVVELGPMRQEVLIRGDSVWALDHNGRRTAGDPQARTEAEMARLVMFQDVYLEPEGRISLLGDTVVAGDSAVALQVSAGQDFRVYLSTTTWLPLLQTSEIMGMQALSYPSRWREVDGITSPGATMDTLPALGQGIRTLNLLTEYDQTIPDGVFSLSSSQVDWELESPGEPFDFMLSGEHIYVEGSVAGRETTLLLDTGAGATVLDSTLAAELGLAPAGRFSAQGVGGTSNVAFVEVPTYRLGPALITGQNLAVMHLDERFYPSTGMHIGMIVGYDLLSRFVTMIDYSAEEIAFYLSSDFVYEGPGRPLDMELDMSLITVEATLEDSIPVRLMVDTGAGGNLHLTPAFFEANPEFLNERPTVESSMEGAGGEESSLLFRVDSMELAGYRIPVGLCSRFSGTEALSRYDGIIGTGVLARFRIWLDYDGNRVILEPSELFEDGIPEDVTGFGVRVREGRLVVNRVLEGSPAELAGLLEGDTIRAVGGMEVGPENLYRLHQLLPDRPGQRVVVSVLRQGLQRELALESARLLPLP